WDEAHTEFKQARDIWKKLADKSHGNRKFMFDLATAKYDLGSLPIAKFNRRTPPTKTEMDAARAELEEARDIFLKLAETYPAVPSYRRELSATHDLLGGLLDILNDPKNARVERDAAIQVMTKLCSDFKEVPEYTRALGSHYSNYGFSY